MAYHPRFNSIEVGPSSTQRFLKDWADWQHERQIFRVAFEST
jgi:hypothetical protein